MLKYEAEHQIIIQIAQILVDVSGKTFHIWYHASLSNKNWISNGAHRNI